MQAWRKVMADYRWVDDSHHLQADCQEPGAATEPHALLSSMGYLYLFYWAAQKTEKRSNGHSYRIERGSHKFGTVSNRDKRDARASGIHRVTVT